MQKFFLQVFMQKKELNMRINLNTYTPNAAFSAKKYSIPKSQNIRQFLEPFKTSKEAFVPSLTLTKGIPITQKNVFDTFDRLDEVTKQIDFVKTEKEWDECLLEELEEFKIARREYQKDSSPQNFEHMEEEMGDLLFATSRVAKTAGIDPENALRTTNRKFFNRLNLMERLAKMPNSSTPSSLKDCKSYERRALWNDAKRRLYDAQSQRFTANA